MDFSYNDIQTEFRAMLRRFLAERVMPLKQDDPRDAALRWRNAHWTELAELGAVAALLPENYDGMGGDSIDAVSILEEIGRGHASPPIIENAIVAAGLIDRLGSEAQKQEFLPAIAAGGLKFAFADGGIQTVGVTESGFALKQVGPGKFRLDGRQALVVEAPACDRLIVLAGGASGAPGLTLFSIAPDHAGVEMRACTTLDGRPAAALILAAVELGEADPIGAVGAAPPALFDVLDLASVAQCAEATGIMASLLNQTIQHLRTRSQFGQKLADFQALQHRLADMYAAYELALSITYKAAILSRTPGTVAQRAAVSAAKVQVQAAASLIGHEAIQMHGAMGMTVELPVGREVKRLKAMEPQFGSTSYHLRRYRALAQNLAA